MGFFAIFSMPTLFLPPCHCVCFLPLCCTGASAAPITEYASYGGSPGLQDREDEEGYEDEYEEEVPDEYEEGSPDRSPAPAPSHPAPATAPAAAPSIWDRIGRALSPRPARASSPSSDGNVNGSGPSSPLGGQRGSPAAARAPSPSLLRIPLPVPIPNTAKQTNPLNSNSTNTGAGTSYSGNGIEDSASSRHAGSSPVGQAPQPQGKQPQGTSQRPRTPLASFVSAMGGLVGNLGSSSMRTPEERGLTEDERTQREDERTQGEGERSSLWEVVAGLQDLREEVREETHKWRGEGKVQPGGSTGGRQQPGTDAAGGMQASDWTDLKGSQGLGEQGAWGPGSAGQMEDTSDQDLMREIERERQERQQQRLAAGSQAGKHASWGGASDGQQLLRGQGGQLEGRWGHERLGVEGVGAGRGGAQQDVEGSWDGGQAHPSHGLDEGKDNGWELQGLSGDEGKEEEGEEEGQDRRKEEEEEERARAEGRWRFLTRAEDEGSKKRQANGPPAGQPPVRETTDWDATLFRGEEGQKLKAMLEAVGFQFGAQTGAQFNPLDPQHLKAQLGKLQQLPVFTGWKKKSAGNGSSAGPDPAASSGASKVQNRPWGVLESEKKGLKVTGVTLDSGEFIAADVVVSNRCVGWCGLKRLLAVTGQLGLVSFVFSRVGDRLMFSGL